tara:strand:+ start:485 stop:754 length:270 start_codon:yes stop_codon:yes gene_type:complete
MNLSEHDLEFILQLYDTAHRLVADKLKQDFANDWLFKLDDYGFDIKGSAKDIGEHDEYLDRAVTEFLEGEEEYGEPEEEWFEDEEYWDE